MQTDIENEKPTIEEVKQQLEAIGLPDVTAEEIMTLVRAPLAHLAFKSEAGDYIRVFTQHCAFMLHVPSLRVMVDAPVTAKLHEVAQIVKRHTLVESPKNRKQRREKPAPDVRTVVHPRKPEVPADDIEDGLEEDTAAVVAA